MRTLLMLAGVAFSSVTLTRSAAAQVKDLCTLLTQAEAEVILGKKPVPPQPQTSGDCWYGSGTIILHALARPFTAAELQAQVEKTVKRINDRAKGIGPVMKAEAVTVPGAAAAYYDGLSLHVLKGQRVLTISAEKPKAVAVAEKAVPRW